MTTPADVLKTIKDKEVKFIDLRFTDTRGKEQHVTIPANLVDEELFRDGKMFDGSSIAGWKGIQESDMILMPEAATSVMDPFMEESTLILRCDVIEPSTMQGYERDPRSLAKRAEAYLKSTGVADTHPIATRVAPFNDAAAFTIHVPSLPIVTAAKPSCRPGGIAIEVSSSPGPTAVR